MLTLPKLNAHNLIILAVVVLAVLKFRSQLLGLVVKIPVVGPFVAVQA